MSGNIEKIASGGIEEVNIEDLLEKPCPVPIVLPHDDHSFLLNEKLIEAILLKEDVKDLKVAVISVAGAFRKGKSFMLNFFLRYLQKDAENDEWMGDENMPLSGFSWRGGSERDTTGILLWNRVFKTKVPSGEEIAILLMDTQGAFDSHSTVKDCATVFALSTMTSSVQVYNISQNIQEDDLQHLQLFTEYGKLAMEEFSDKPFQKLQFLVRDWSYPYEFPYGSGGGKGLLQKRLTINEKQHDEIQRVRNHIQACFAGLNCFLMPHPGLQVAINPQFTGALKEIDGDFKKCLKDFVPSLLSAENLVVKKINGVDITCKELVVYFKSYIKMYQGEELPEPKTMLQATAEANNLSAVSQAKDLYNNQMENVCGGDESYITPEKLEDYHQKFKTEALEYFDNTRKMGGEDVSTKYRTDLITALDEAKETFSRANDAKNIFTAGRTPFTFFLCAIAAYTLSFIFGLIYLNSISGIFNMLFIASLVALVVWSYARFSNQHNEVASQLDNIANVVWEQFVSNVYGAALESGTEALARQATTELTRRMSVQRKKNA